MIQEQVHNIHDIIELEVKSGYANVTRNMALNDVRAWLLENYSGWNTTILFFVRAGDEWRETDFEHCDTIRGVVYAA